jgi:hypothetical protein
VTNKELLELAAKAARIEGEYVSWCYNGFREGIRKPKDKHRRPWNPLTEDDDALRLSVKLNMDVVFDFDRVMVVFGNGDGTCITEYFYELPNPTDRYAATRRAIVRAAAEIGKTL